MNHIVIEGPELSNNVVSFDYIENMISEKDSEVNFNVEIFVDLSTPAMLLQKSSKTTTKVKKIHSDLVEET